MVTGSNGAGRIFNARADGIDFRDQMYEAALVDVPQEIPLADYRANDVPILDQGVEGACTGFGLATVANYLLRTRAVRADTDAVSARMLYEMARRHDEWPGESYSGSSARGAMKGWHKHGVCLGASWPYVTGQPGLLTAERSRDAARRPLGAYYRVNHKDLVHMHAALAEVGIVYATATVHEGWQQVGADGVIRLSDRILGGHAFALVAYDEHGFWLQNSWGDAWGNVGFARISYSDWLANGTDVWVARLGVPVVSGGIDALAGNLGSGTAGHPHAAADLRPHVISVGNEGRLRGSGPCGTSEEQVRALLLDDFVEVTRTWEKKRLLIYAHGGMVGERAALDRVADLRRPLLDHEIYPVAFIWKTDYWTTLKNILRDALGRRRSEGFLDDAKDFMLDRLDGALEPLARVLTGKAVWDEMKENAIAASRPGGAAAIFLKYLAELLLNNDVELHIAGHSAGSVFLAHVLERITAEGTLTSGPCTGLEGLGQTVETATLWAPAITLEAFHKTYGPALGARRVKRFGLFTLTDEVERDDHCAHIYNKSLLYLVSNAFEEKPRVPWLYDGAPLLGMEKFVREDKRLQSILRKKSHDWVRSPNDRPEGEPDAAGATSHGGFDDDNKTLKATLARILVAKTASASFHFASSKSARGDRRRQLT